MERIHQDTDFVIDNLNGCKVVILSGIVDIKKSDNIPVLINLRTDSGSCSRFFLEAGFAFWEEWEQFDDLAEDETREVDYAEIYGLRNKIIKSIRCVNSAITISFEENIEFILKFIDETDIDSDSEIIVH